jgi:poly-gamma-glutamate synthesis protein (capsule biosynthesis protein)
MKMSSGLVAFVPLEEVRLVTMAIAIDGVDVVRGRGDASSWPFVETVPVSSGSKAGDSILASIRTTLTAQPPKVTRIVATGDILQSRCSLAAIEATGDWAAALRGPMADYLAAADLTLGSLDGSIQDVNPVYKCVAQDYPNLSSPPEVMAALTLAGFDEMTVATNHVFDCGVSPCGSAAFLQTIDRLRAAGIQTVGGGKNLDEALAPAIFEVNGVKFGVLGFDDIAAEDLEATATEPGTAPMDDSYADEKADLPHEPAFYKPADMLHTTQMESAIRNLKKQVDVVIVQLQSGYEDTHDTNPRSIKGLRAAADAGADLVVGNQGHFVQPAEVRGNTFIDYALGNFIFDQTRLEGHTEGYLLEASFWGKQLANVRMVPYQIVDKYKPTFVDGSLRAKILDDVFTASASLPE